MKKLIFICSLFLTLTATAQIPSEANPINSNLKTGVISGIVIDKNTNTAIPYVSIIIKNTEDKIQTGGITDDEGNFTIKQIPEGESIVEIQFIGYKTEVKKILISQVNTKIDLGTIELKEETSQLDEVLVVEVDVVEVLLVEDVDVVDVVVVEEI